ncbi:MAG: YccF domain-containing protein [Bacteroidales bacterium]|nr:YccF domain-containing protein [Bacteroidales bacterium]
MGCLGNILWLILGGFITAVEYFISGALLCLTIIGIPFGYQVFKLGILALWPFGATITTKPEAGGCLNVFMNILWILIGGIWIALTHLIFGVICCITIIGIPFGLQHFKLAALAIAPFGKQIN